MAVTQPGVNRASQDIVAILDATNYQILFAGANPMRCTVRETSVITKWAVEDGTNRTDHRTINATEIDLPLLLTDDTRALYEQLRSVYLAGTELIVQTKVGSHAGMMILEIPREEVPDAGAAILINVKLSEIVQVKPQLGTLPSSSVSSRRQSSTTARGNQQTTEADGATNRRASVLYGVFN